MEKMPSRKSRKPGKRGPRPKRAPRLDQDSIVSAGLALTKTVPLQDVSIVRLAHKLGVTPASLHYHLDGRGALTGSIVSRFFRELLSEWPGPAANPLANLETAAWSIYRQYVRYPGIAAYFAGHNRFDLLIKSARQPDSENLYRFLERYFAVIESAGLNAESAAIYAFVLIQFTIAAAHASASHQLPSEQHELGVLLSSLPRAEYPAIHRMRRSYLGLTGDDAFAAGLRFLMAGLPVTRRTRPAKKAKR
jgi:AcrR family transcriptional regulator